MLDPPDGFAPGVGMLMAMLEDCRDRTRRLIESLDPALVDAVPPWDGNTVGSLLYHVAAIELDWIHADVLQAEFPDGAWDWFPHDVREEDGRLTPMLGDDLERHLARLDRVRRWTREALRTLSDDDLRSPRPLGEHTTTPAWILHHLMQHEAEHRGQMGEIVMALGG